MGVGDGQRKKSDGDADENDVAHDPILSRRSLDEKALRSKQTGADEMNAEWSARPR
jgi:hypothetical protein